MMTRDDCVDAALAGFHRREVPTIPSLDDHGGRARAVARCRDRSLTKVRGWLSISLSTGGPAPLVDFTHSRIVSQNADSRPTQAGEDDRPHQGKMNMNEVTALSRKSRRKKSEGLPVIRPSARRTWMPPPPIATSCLPSLGSVARSSNLVGGLQGHALLEDHFRSTLDRVPAHLSARQENNHGRKCRNAACQASELDG